MYGKTDAHGGVALTIPEDHRNAITYGCKWEMDSHDTPKELCQGMIFDRKEQKVVDTYARWYKEYVLQARWQFIMGVMDPKSDEAWNNYLMTLQANGEKPLLEAYQTAYTRIYG